MTSFCCASSDLITPLSALASAIIAGIGLKVLVGYARDTRKIAKAAIDQIEESSLPYLTLMPPPTGSTLSQRCSYVLVNLGKGPAANIRLAFELAEVEFLPGGGQQVKAWTNISHAVPDLGPSMEFCISGNWVQTLLAAKPFIMEYDSLGKRKYRSIYVRNDEGFGQTNFDRL